MLIGQKNMATITDIVDAVSDLMSRSKLPRCITDATGMARWPMFNMAIVSAVNYYKKFWQLEEFSKLEASVYKLYTNLQRINTMKQAVPAQDHVIDPKVESQSTDKTPTAEDIGSTTGTANLSKVTRMRRNLARLDTVLNISGDGAITYPVPNLYVDVNKDSGACFQMADSYFER